ncbi:MAG: hypothetical protein RR795_04560 [Cetobacterium sp.]|uniref:hypothetical protein n=1 Tax=Cetobacterium sp. TaxID=2071632 RepID=UPI002FC825F5
MFFITGIIIAALFLVSTSIPLLSWVLPFYKIKKLENADLKTKVIANVVAVAIIGWVDYKFLITYIGVFVSIEVLYLLFKKYGNKIEYFDRIFITSLIVGGLVCGYMYFNRVGLNISLENLKTLYIQKTEFSKPEIDMAFKYIKENFSYLVFLYMNVTVFLMYYFLNKEDFINWEVSYLWLVPYISLFFLERYLALNNTLILNGMNILKIVYSLYFVRIVTKALNEKIKQQQLSFIVGVFLALMSPEFAFIFGALASGIKIQVIKQK